VKKMFYYSCYTLLVLCSVLFKEPGLTVLVCRAVIFFGYHYHYRSRIMQNFYYSLCLRILCSHESLNMMIEYVHVGCFRVFAWHMICW